MRRRKLCYDTNVKTCKHRFVVAWTDVIHTSYVQIEQYIHTILQLQGFDNATLKKMQRVQNLLVHITVHSNVWSNAKQNLANLQWLHVRTRIHFKIALLTFKSITTQRPTYLSDLLQFWTSSHHLRSSDHCLFHDAGDRTVFGSRIFCHNSLTIWNSLPADLTDNFNSMLLFGIKCSLKTYFYKFSFAT